MMVNTNPLNMLMFDTFKIRRFTVLETRVQPISNIVFSHLKRYKFLTK